MPANASPQLAAARRDYLTKLERAERAEAADDAEHEGATEERARDLASDALYSREAADQAFGFLARMAEAEGFRACLCGKLERSKKR